MKAPLKFVFALGFLLLAQAGTFGQTYTINWYSIDSGGGTSTGGVYSVSGSIGQPDAGKMSGGNFALDGGFWGILAPLQTPGAPALLVGLTHTNTVLVSWSVSDPAWHLEAADLLGPGTVWTGCSHQTNGASCYHLELPVSGNRFFRLRK